MPCDCCENRHLHRYNSECQRCKARQIARTPKRVLAQYAMLFDDAELNRMIDEERAADAHTRQAHGTLL